MEKINGVITFEDGKEIKIELYPQIAPISVKRFTEVARSGFYNGMCFHRVIPGFMIQGGGFIAAPGKLTDKEGKLPPIKGEFSSNGVKNDLKHSTGVLSMARTNVKDSATCQFFITVDNANFLDGEYAAFGKVSDEASMRVAVDISKVPTTSVGYYQDVPVKPVVIKNVTIF